MPFAEKIRRIGLFCGNVLPRTRAEREAGLLINRKRMDNNIQPTPDVKRPQEIFVFCLSKDVDREALEENYFEPAANLANPTPKVFRWPQSSALERELEAIGELGLAGRCRDELSAEDARAFGKQLLDLAEKLEERFREAPAENHPSGAVWSYMCDPNDGRWLPEVTSSLEEVLDCLRQGGQWYQEAGSTVEEAIV